MCLSLSACNESSEDRADEETVAVEEQEIPFAELAGDWADTSGDHDFYESWELTGAGLTGFGVSLSDGDTVFTEHLEIFEREGEWYYSARVQGQNFSEGIEFLNTLREDSLYIFENPNHDFPQAIAYQFRRSGVLQIKTRGTEGDTIRTEEYNMRPFEK